MIRFDADHWALILGGSSGFGLATARKLAAHGMSVCVVHRDRRGAMPRIEQAFDEIRAHGHGFVALNLDALAPEGLDRTIEALREAMGAEGRVKALLHSIAFGNLKPLVAPRGPRRDEQAVERLAAELGLPAADLQEILGRLASEGEAPLQALVPVPEGQACLEDEDMARTIYSMGTSLLTWVQRLHGAGLFAQDARVMGLTSEGNQVAWRGYAAVAAAKVALESVSRAIAVEFGPYGIRSNVLQAGVTDTPALRLIPGSARMAAHSLVRNPLGRLTQPEDVADVVCLLCTPEAAWINGTLVRVDGGEHVSA
jgi:NAD(P)-dependent dehydrogenase (short-subunit alcohol dehydrogenase family)